MSPDPSASGPLHARHHVWRRELAGSPFAHLLAPLLHGFHLEVTSPVAGFAADNYASCLDHREAISAQIAEMVAAGWAAGPFSSPPFPDFVVSPLGAVPKRDTSEIRIILD